jgi:protein SCO1/2
MSRLRIVIWSVSALLALGLAVSAGMRAFGGSGELPVLFAVRPFSLVDQDGRAFASSALRGRPWIGAFVFTTCKTICPMITAQQGNVARRLRDVSAIRFVSITVDPAHDTPAVLRAYGERHHADFTRWSFLTGEPAVVQRVVEGGLFQPIGEREARPDGAWDIVHTGRLLLVDGEGRARRLYALDAASLAQLEQDARALAR